MFQLVPHTGGGASWNTWTNPKKSIPVKNVLLLSYLFACFMWPKYMWLDMRDAFGRPNTHCRKRYHTKMADIF